MAYDPMQAALMNWEEFVRAMQSEFGEPHPHFAAQHRLYHLRMAHDARVMDFNQDFHRDATPSQLGSNALAMLYYEVLLSRLQNEINCIGRPDNISTLARLTTRIDRAY